MKSPLYFCCLFIPLVSAFGQPVLHFEQLTDEDGLSNGFVTSMYQDEKGFLWFGTANGLNRYDGYQFKTWVPEEGNSNSLSQAVIWSLCGSNDGAIWIGTDKGLNRFDPRTETFTRFFHDPTDDRSLSHDKIRSIAEDKDSNLWIGTDNGLSILQKGTNQFSRYFYDPVSDEGKVVRSIARDEEDYMWFGFMDTLFCFNPINQKFQGFPLPVSSALKERSSNFAKVLMLENETNLWLSTDLNGIYLFDKKVHRFVSNVKSDSNNGNILSQKRISSFQKDDQGNLWIGCYGGGLNILSPDHQSIHHFQPDPFNPVHQNFDVVRSMLKDRAGDIWLGTFYGGAKVVLKNKKPFINYFPIPGKAGSLEAPAVGTLFERADGTIWACIDEHGLFLFDPKTESFTRFAPKGGEPGDLGNKNVFSVLEEKNGDLWIITRNEIWKMNGQTKRWTNMQPSGIPGKGVWFLSQYVDRQGNHWIGTQGGLFLYDRSSNALMSKHLENEKSEPELGNNTYVESFFESDNGDLWICTHGGIYLHPYRSDEFRFFPFHQQVLCAHQDKSGILWLGTIEGLAFLNAERQKLEYYPKAKALVGKLVHSILEDDQGRLWMGSKTGVICFDQATGSYREYNQRDGLVNRQFFGTHLKTKTGEFYFGGTKGLLRFHPDSIRDNQSIPPVLLTNFQILNKDVPIRGSLGDTLKHKSPLLKNISYTDTILLQHWQNDLAFEFAALDFTAQMNNRYQFKLEGNDDLWVETDASRRFAHYTNLKPGKYTFKVRGSNNDGVWNETSVFIRIRPPWQATWWAYLLWSGLAAGTLFFIRRYELRRRQIKEEARYLMELDTAKSKLYTNITHEFRTPLTIILGVTKDLAKKVDESMHSDLKMISRNGDQLLSLVNQMLDLAKVESGAMQLKMIQGDVLNYLRYLAESFHSLAESRNIRLHFLTNAASFEMDYEPLRLQQIVSNLLSNAFKFTPEGGDVYFFADQRGESFEMRISDTGIGIPADQLSHIFDPFFQVDDSATQQAGGTGIGLALTRELVHLMKGTISVSSKLGGGTEFTVLLPITHTAEKQNAEIHEALIENPQSPISSQPTTIASEDEQAPMLLVVEDNHDVVKYLLTCLNTKYRIEIAYNGQQGIEKAIELIPDLIVSDVMMPQKDGFELCQKLKTDERTSHIPIILLTAKADIESKLSGLQRGADAYLAKPFQKEELLTYIRNLLEVRRRLQTYYLAQAGLSTSRDNITQKQVSPGQLPDQVLEHAFIQKVRALLEADLTRQWSVTDLAKELLISLSQLHRKLHALTGMHTTEFVRYVRLVNASRLLHLRPDERIADIAYEVGFTSPSEFNRRFRELFGKTPGEWRGREGGF